MSSTTVCCTPHHAALPSPERVGPWLRRVWRTAQRMLKGVAWRFPVQAAPEELDLYSLAYLSDTTLQDIGAPDGLRAYAAQRREQAELLRRIETERGAVGVSRW
jgi:hypothetical protein